MKQKETDFNNFLSTKHNYVCTNVYLVPDNEFAIITYLKGK